MTTRLTVTDHAVLRYLERVHGVDVDGLRHRIARIVERAEERCGLEGAAAVRSNGHRIVIRQDRVVTITPIASMPADPAARRCRRRDGP